MTAGILLALVAAALYGAGGVAIAQARTAAIPQDGVLLAALLTAAFSGVLWAMAGRVGLGGLTAQGFGWFALSGLLATVFGRQAMYAAAALSAGQTVQFFALAAAPVAIVAVIGTLEVLFAALLVRFVFQSEAVNMPRLLASAALAAAGTALMLL